MLQPKKPAKKAESRVIKPMAKKDRFKNLGGEIGSPPFPNGRKGMPYRKPTLGDGKTVAKNGKSFPDLNKDGKVTKADILKGRGVIAKKGATIKKAQMGRLIKKGVKEVAKKTVTKKPLPKINNATWEAAMSEVGREDLKAKMKLWDKDLSKKKNGGSMKKCRYGCK